MRTAKKKYKTIANVGKRYLVNQIKAAGLDPREEIETAHNVAKSGFGTQIEEFEKELTRQCVIDAMEKAISMQNMVIGAESVRETSAAYKHLDQAMEKLKQAMIINNAEASAWELMHRENAAKQKEAKTVKNEWQNTVL